MEKKLASIFKYFAIFGYFPDFEEVYAFFPEKISRKRLKTLYEAKKYTLGEYSIKQSQISNVKSQISRKKLSNWRFRAYVKLVSLFPQIKLVGLSGSISMMNAKEDDDIDLFIITAKNRLFTGRFIALVLAQLLGLRRSRHSGKRPSGNEGMCPESKDRFWSSFQDKRSAPQNDNLYANKICLNLFFDENNLRVPKFKQTLFVGHEVLQMKPIINKSYTYERFVYANRWVLSFFPNVAEISNFKFLISDQFQISKFKNYKLNKDLKLKIENLGDWIESSLKKFQLRLINKHKTTETVTNTQLWFHPDDFERKIEKMSLRGTK